VARNGLLKFILYTITATKHRVYLEIIFNH